MHPEGGEGSLLNVIGSWILSCVRLNQGGHTLSANFKKTLSTKNKKKKRYLKTWNGRTSIQRG